MYAYNFVISIHIIYICYTDVINKTALVIVGFQFVKIKCSDTHNTILFWFYLQLKSNVRRSNRCKIFSPIIENIEIVFHKSVYPNTPSCSDTRSVLKDFANEIFSCTQIKT